jgi:hypothetical protein
MIASESSSKSIVAGSNGVRAPKSISPGNEDGVSSEDDCGVVALVGPDDEGEGTWLVEVNTDGGEEANVGTAPLKDGSLGSPLRGTVNVNAVFLRETFSSWRRFKSSLR